MIENGWMKNKVGYELNKEKMRMEIKDFLEVMKKNVEKEKLVKKVQEGYEKE